MSVGDRRRRVRAWRGRTVRTIAAQLGVVAVLACVLDAGPLVAPSPAAAATCPSVDMCLTLATNNAASSLSLPFGGAVAVTVDWGDGSPTASYTAPGDTPAHVYPPDGTYTVVIAPDTAASPSGPWLTRFGDPGGYTGASLITGVTSFGALGTTSLAGAFVGATGLTTVPATLPAGVTDLSSAFMGATTFNPSSNGQSIDTWDTSAVTNMADMFNGASGFDSGIGDWDTSHVTDMSDMFDNAVAFDQPVGAWDTGAVTTMRGMFSGAVGFDQPVGAWNTAHVADMGSMFAGAAAFDEPLAGWDTGSVTSMRNMFNGDFAFNQPVGTWDTGHVADMSGMFENATSFDRPIGAWNISAATTMNSMFSGAAAFDQPLAGWDTSHVADMSSMFADAAVFNAPIGGWDTGAVTTMADMFAGAAGFDQPIGTWNVTGVTTMARMFGGAAGLSLGNYDELLNGWATEAVHGGVAFDAGSTPFNGLASAAHGVLTNPAGDAWAISDGGPTDARIPSIIESVPVATGITYGQRLADSRLVGGAASTPGTFGFVTPTEAPAAGAPRVAVRFVPASPYYAPATFAVTVTVAKGRATLMLTGLKTVRHGRAVTMSVAHLVDGARLSVVWQTGRHVYRRALTATGSTARVALSLPVRAVYRVTASASDPNMSFRSALGAVRAT
jgi:surface protein